MRGFDAHCPVCGGHAWRIGVDALVLATCMRCGVGFPATPTAGVSA